MRQNIISAAAQTAMSLIIAAMSVAIFRFLSPDQVAFIRQNYLIPFAIATALLPANQNYLRSILFSKETAGPIEQQRASLGIVQALGAASLLALTTIVTMHSGSRLEPIAIAALAAAILFVSVRTIAGGYLEFNGRYLTSIVLTNLGTAIPYLSAVAIAAFYNSNIFFICVIAFHILLTLATLGVGRAYYEISSAPLFRIKGTFDFRRYGNLCLIAVGSVIVYQGVEFCLYNYTSFSKSEIANYALAFSACAVIRQIIITAVQPLEQDRHYNSIIKLKGGISLPRPLAIEATIYCGIVAATLTLPAVFSVVFPAYRSAGHFVAPILLGVLGSAVQQIYAVRMITESRTSFLSKSQLVLAASCIVATLVGGRFFSLLSVIWLVSILTWVRGCIIIPSYAELRTGLFETRMWIFRGGISLLLLAFIF